jgi:virulence factor Mce-like protein
MKSLLTNKLYQSAIGVAAVFLVCLTYLFGSVLDTPLTSRPTHIVVELTTTGGLYVGSSVTYRGVKIGKVTDIRLSSNGVEAEVTLTSTDKIPRSSKAIVRSLSPVGEQYLDFQPDSAAGPYLQNGSRIPAAATDVPKTLASTVVALQKMLDQVNDRQLHSVLTELSVGLAGTGADIGRLTDQGSLLVKTLQQYWPQTNRLLTNGGTVLDIGTDNTSSIEKLATSSKKFGAFLKSYDPQLRKTLNNAPGQITTLQSLLSEVQKVLPGFLHTGVDFSELLAAHDPEVRALLTNYVPGFGVLSGAVKNKSIQLGLIGQTDNRCNYGTPVRSARASQRPMRTDARCAASFSTLQRGAAHAPQG